MQQYLSIQNIPEEERIKARRNSRLQFIARNSNEYPKTCPLTEDEINSVYERAKKDTSQHVIDFWENRLIWESGPNPPYLQTQFHYDEKDGYLHLTIHNSFLNIQTTLALTTNDKIAMIQAINKDNNRIKNLMEQNKTVEYQNINEPLWDKITSKEKENGIEWYYMKDGEVKDTAFMTYKELYEIQVGQHGNRCQFCTSHETRQYRPRDEDTAIWLCGQHEKYIQRVSQRIHGEAEVI